MYNFLQIFYNFYNFHYCVSISNKSKNKGPLAFLEMLLLNGVFKVLLLLTLERRVVYASHEHIQANTYNK